MIYRVVARVSLALLLVAVFIIHAAGAFSLYGRIAATAILLIAFAVLFSSLGIPFIQARFSRNPALASKKGSLHDQKDSPFSVLSSVKNPFANQGDKQLTESTEFSRKIIEASTSGIVAYRADGQCILANEAAENLVGIPVEELLQQNFYSIDSWKEAGLVEEAERALQTGIVQKGEAFLAAAKRTQLWIRYSYSCFQSRGEDHLLMIFEDITNRKQMEERLAQKNRDMETLLYITSHDLREPLRSMQNFSKLVADRYADRLDEKGKDFLNRVVIGASRMEELIDDILQLSRAQRLIQPEELVNGKDLVEDALKKLEARIDESKASIRIGDEFPSFRVDRIWSTQAIYNLVANAIKFTEEGQHPDIEIMPYVADDKRQAGVSVKDRGVGIAQETSERIFGLFKRDVGREVKGSGAGLAIVKEVAERHGGFAWARPRENGGSAFFITFGPEKAQEGGIRVGYSTD